MTAPRVLALDLSLNATGAAFPDGTTCTLTPAGHTGVDRLDYMRDVIEGVLIAWKPDLVVIEGYAYGRANQAHQMGELGGVIRLLLYNLGQPHTVIPPTSLKKYATGKGNASKEQVLAEAIRRLDYDGHDNNQADALWLRAMTLDHLGHPVTTVPATHRTAIDNIEWTEGGS